MAYDLTGKIKLIQEPQTFNSGFTKREMVVTVEDSKYPQDISLEFVQDKIALLDGLQPGQEVTVTFDIRGREYNGRYFNNLQGWKITSGEASSVPPPDSDDYQSQGMPASQSGDPGYGEDDIPF